MDVSRETRERLATFAELLLKWTQRINLIAPATLPQVWHRHVLDSLQLLPLIPAGTSRAIDLGSGGGFPAMVLAIAGNIPFDLVESDQRKCAFLREAARVTEAPATVHAVRIEAARLPPAPLVTARALAPLRKLLGLAHPFLQESGQALFLKGETAQDELTEASQEWHMVVHRAASQTDPRASILQITGLQRLGNAS